MDRYFRKRDWWILGILTAVAVLFRFVRLHLPAEIIFDETYFAKFAHNYLTGAHFFDAEPPLGKFIIAAGEWIFSSNPNATPVEHAFGWRFMPALFGAAVIPLMYALTKRLFGGVVMPTIAAALALLDGLLLVESRTALLDIFVVFFNLLTYLLFLLHLQAKRRSRSFWLLLATGVSLGLGLSLKWITLAFLGPAVALLFVLYHRKRPWLKKLFKVRRADLIPAQLGIQPENLRGPFTYLVMLGLVPAAVYVNVFLPHVPFDSTSGTIWSIHDQIFRYHHTLVATHPYGSDWYSWPFLGRPVLYYFNANGGQWAAIVALGNPLIWWGGILAVAFAFWRFLARRHLAVGFILLAILAHYGPWALIGRVLFIYHYMGALPFVMMALAFALTRSWFWRPRGEASLQVFFWTLLLAGGAVLGGLCGRSLFGSASPFAFIGGGLAVMLPMLALMATDFRRLRWGQKQTIAFMALVGLAFVYFMPLWYGLHLDTADFRMHLWLRSWI